MRTRNGCPHGGTALPRIVEWRQHLAAFERGAGYARDRFTVRGAGEPRLAGVALVDDEFFETLGARPVAGTPFRRGDSMARAVVSARFVREAGASSSADLLGRTLTVGVTPVAIVAVMPAAFAFPAANIDVWIPAQAAPGIAFDRSPDARRFQLVGRLRPGVSLTQARDDVARAGAVVETPGDRQRSSGVVSSKDLTRTVRPRDRVAVEAHVLIAACSNVALLTPDGVAAARLRCAAPRRQPVPARRERPLGINRDRRGGRRSGDAARGDRRRPHRAVGGRNHSTAR
jgi:hypothetical protein